MEAGTLKIAKKNLYYSAYRNILKQVLFFASSNQKFGLIEMDFEEFEDIVKDVTDKFDTIINRQK